jgi:hypothetical protein
LQFENQGDRKNGENAGVATEENLHGFQAMEVIRMSHGRRLLHHQQQRHGDNRPDGCRQHRADEQRFGSYQVLGREQAQPPFTPCNERHDVENGRDRIADLPHQTERCLLRSAVVDLRTEFCQRERRPITVGQKQQATQAQAISEAPYAIRVRSQQQISRRVRDEHGKLPQPFVFTDRFHHRCTPEH